MANGQAPAKKLRAGKSRSPRKAPRATTAIHAETKDGDHVVGIGNLRVMLVQDDGSWFAQGLEIDYYVQGDTVEETTTCFEDGLHATLDEHIKTYGSIHGLLRVAPQDVWEELYSAAPTVRSYSQISLHRAIGGVFSGIEFLQRRETAAR